MSSNPPTAFYLVRGEGVRDNEWHLSSPEPLTYSNLPSTQSYRILNVPSNTKNALFPVVRIFPPQAVPNFVPLQNPSSHPHSNQSSAANNAYPTSSVVTAPVAVPAASHSFLSTQIPPRQHSFTGAAMIARPEPGPNINSSRLPGTNPTFPSPSNEPSSQSLPTCEPIRPKARSSLQAKSPSTTASNAEQTAALRDVVDDIRDRKRRTFPSKNLPPLPKLPEKPSSKSTSVSRGEPQQKPRHGMVACANRDTSNGDHANKRIVTSTVPVKKELVVGVPDDLTQSGAGAEGTTGESDGKDRGGERKQVPTNARTQGEINETQAKKSTDQHGDLNGRASKLGKKDVDMTTAASASGRLDAAVNGAEKSNVVASAKSKVPSVTHEKGMDKVNSRVGDEFKPVPAALPAVNKNGAIPAPRAADSRRNQLSELRSEPFGLCIRLLAQLVSLCNTQSAMSAEKSKQLRNELHSVVGRTPATSPGETPLRGPKESKEVLKNDTKQRRTDSQAQHPQSKDSADLIAQAKSDQRGVRFKFLRWRMLISKSDVRLQDIAADCKQIVNICDAFSKFEKGSAISDDELLEHVSDLNLSSGTVRYLIVQAKSYLQSIESDGGDRSENMDGVRLSTLALRDISRWILYLTEQVSALWLRCIKLPEDSGDVSRFCIVMGNMVTTSQQATSEGEGIIFVLRELKKSCPTSKEFPTDGAGDGKPYFSRRRKIGDDVTSILRILAFICTWAMKRSGGPKENEADDDKAEETDLQREKRRAVEGNALKSAPLQKEAQKPSLNVSARQGERLVDNEGKSAQKGNMLPSSKVGSRDSIPRRPLPPNEEHGRGKRGANEVDSKVETSDTAKGSGGNSTTTMRGQERIRDTYTIPRRSNKRPEEQRDTPRPSTSRNGGNTTQTPLQKDSDRLDNAALVRARLSNSSLAGKRKREDAEQECGASQSGQQVSGERKIGRGTEANGKSASDGDEHQKKKRKKKGLRVSFAEEVVAGSVETAHKKEELEFVFQDGYDLLGCRNGMQEEAVEERANQLQRGAVVALFGYLRAEFLRLKLEAETTRTEPTPTLVDLRLTPPALKQIERRLPLDQPANPRRTD